MFTDQDVVDALLDMDEVDVDPTGDAVHEYIRQNPDLLDLARSDAAEAVADRLRLYFRSEDET